MWAKLTGRGGGDAAGGAVGAVGGDDTPSRPAQTEHDEQLLLHQPYVGTIQRRLAVSEAGLGIGGYCRVTAVGRDAEGQLWAEIRQVHAAQRGAGRGGDPAVHCQWVVNELSERLEVAIKECTGLVTLPPKLRTNTKQLLDELQTQASGRVRLLVGSRGAGPRVAKLRAKFLLSPTLLSISSVIAAVSRKHLGEAFSARALRHNGEADIILYEKYCAALKAVATVVNGAGSVANPQAGFDPEARISAGIQAAVDMLLAAVDEKIMARLPKEFVTHMAGSNAAVSKAEEDVAAARKARAKAAQATVLEAKVLEPAELKALKAKGADAAVLEAKVLKVLEAKAKLHRQVDTTKGEYDTAAVRYNARLATKTKDMAELNAAVGKAESDVAAARKARSQAAQATVLEAKVLELSELKALKAKGADALEEKVLKVFEAKVKLHRQVDTKQVEYDTAKARYYARLANNAKGLKSETESMKKLHDVKLAELEELKSRSLFTMAAEGPARVQIVESKVAALTEARHSQQEFKAETESMKKMHDAKLAELEELKSRNLFTMAAENPALIQVTESKVAALKEARHSQQEQQALLDTATAALPAARLDVAGKLRVSLNEWSEVAKKQMSGHAGFKVDTLVRELWQVPSSIEGKLREAMLTTLGAQKSTAMEEELPSILHRELAAAMDQLASACITGAYHSCSLCQDVSTAVPAGAEMEARWPPFEPSRHLNPGPTDLQLG